MPFRAHFDRDLLRLVARGRGAAGARRRRGAARPAPARALRAGSRPAGLRAPRPSARPRTARSRSRRPARASCCSRTRTARCRSRAPAGVAVIGRLAAMPNTGDGGSSNTRPPYVITPLEGLRTALGADVDVVTTTAATPTRAAGVAADADTVVLVVGYTHADEGEYIPPDMTSAFAAHPPRARPEDRNFAERCSAAARRAHDDAARRRPRVARAARRRRGAHPRGRGGQPAHGRRGHGGQRGRSRRPGATRSPRCSCSGIPAWRAAARSPTCSPAP